MKNLIVFVSLVFISISMPVLASKDYVDILLSKENLAKIPEYCKKKWSTRGELNQRMYNRCIDEEKHSSTTIYIKIAEHSDTDKDWLLANNMLKFCGKKNTTRGVPNYSLIDYCLGKQLEGYLNAEYEIKQNPKLRSLYQQCKRRFQRQWGIDWSGVGYCVQGKV